MSCQPEVINSFLSMGVLLLKSCVSISVSDTSSLVSSNWSHHWRDAIGAFLKRHPSHLICWGWRSIAPFAADADINNKHAWRAELIHSARGDEKYLRHTESRKQFFIINIDVFCQSAFFRFLLICLHKHNRYKTYRLLLNPEDRKNRIKHKLRGKRK